MLRVFRLTGDNELERLEDTARLKEVVFSGEGKVWVDLEDPSPEETAVLDEVFGFHPLTIEDCMHPNLHAKVDDYSSYLFTALSNQTNDTMRILTIFASLLLPATVVSSAYGMNIALPGQHHPHAFWIIVGAVFTFSIGFLAYYRHRHWL